MRIDGPQITGSFSIGNTTFPDLSSLATTSSVNSLSSSVATTGSNLFKGTQTLSGSMLPAVNNTYDLGSPTQQFRHVYISTGSLYIDGTKVLGSTSSELQITTDVGQSFKVLETGADTITLQSADGNVTLTSTGGGDVIMDPNTGVIGLKGTVTIYTGNKITSSDGNAIQFGNGIAITGSIVATGTNLISGSSQVLNGSGVWSGSAQLPSGIISGAAQLPSGIVSSSSQVTAYGFSTTGSNNFVGTQTITGSLYISQNLVVQGSSSLQDVTGSNVYIGTNKINLNTATPSVRFGGISVFDSGSNFGESGSLLWDSQNNRWLYQHPASSGAPYKTAMLIAGPMNSGSIGNESSLTVGKIQKAVGDDHIGDSIITETTGSIGISGSLSITGSIVATGTSLVSSSAQILNGTTIHSGSFFNGISVVSGSAQIDVLSTTNAARLATTGSNSFSGTQVWGYGRLTSGYNSSGQITINASYDGGQTNTYTPDYAGSSAAGMFVMKQRNGGEGNFDFYGKNHQTTGGSQSLSTFNIIMGMNTNGSVAIGKLVANAPLDVNGNTLVTGSITSTGNISAGTTINWNGGIGALSYGTGVVTLETNTANAIQLKTNGTTAITINTGQTVNFSTSVGIRTSVFGEYLNIGNGGAVAWQNTSSAQKWHIQYNTSNDGLNFVESAVADYRLFLKAGGRVGINTSSPAGTLDVQSAGANGIVLSADSNDTNNSGRIFLMRTGGTGWCIMNNAQKLSFRSEAVPNSTSGNERMYLDSSYNLILNNGLTINSTTYAGGSILPTGDATYNLGSTSYRWNNVYTTDLHLSNKGSQNSVDGTWGDWTLQEGENDIFMLNNRSGEKFKIKLEKIN